MSINKEQNSNSDGGMIEALRKPKTVAMVLGGVVLAVAAYMLLSNMSQSKATESQIALARARVSYDKGDYLAAINGDSIVKYSKTEKPLGLKGVVEEYGSTNAGKMAALMLANCYMGLGKTKEAKGFYEEATSGGYDLTRSGGYAGLAAINEAEGKAGEAAENYQKAVKEDKVGVNAADNILNAAKNFEKAGKKDDAISGYKEIVTKYGNSNANTEARLALARLNVAI